MTFTTSYKINIGLLNLTGNKLQDKVLKIYRPTVCRNCCINKFAAIAWELIKLKTNLVKLFLSLKMKLWKGLVPVIENPLPEGKRRLGNGAISYLNI